MPSCDNCGSHVSTDYARVFSLDDGTILGCPECSPTSDWTGGTADLDRV